MTAKSIDLAVLEKKAVKRCGSPIDSGAYGEYIAAEYLRAIGYRIRGRNIRLAHEEIDLVAQRRGVRVFTEVKTRRQTPAEENRYGSPAAAVNAEKRRHLASAARRYNALHPTCRMTRMDIIEIYLDPAADGFRLVGLNHIQDAFRA